jgi:outer membrane protein OmpA-like peptidoglycan-associated protein
MALNLIGLAKDYLTPDVISKLSGQIGETPAATERAIGAAVPSLAGVACNTASTPGGATKLLSLLNTSGLDTGILSNFAGVLAGGAATEGLLRTGNNLLGGLLGDKLGPVANTIASFAGIQGSSATRLLGLLAPLLFGLLGKQVASGGLTAASLPGLLASHRDTIMKFAPPGLASALGLGSNSNLCGAAPVAAVPPPVVEKKAFPIWGWLLPLLLLIAAFLWWRSCNPSGPKMANLTLPCGTVLTVQEGTFNYNLANFMMHGSDSDLPKQIVFDNLNFDTGTTRLTPESQPTVTNLITIMKCFPNSQYRLEGHTDNTGDPAANKTLSMDRANAIRDLLVQGGIDSSRLSTEGYGADKPIASNDTDEGRARNRRTELIVLKK